MSFVDLASISLCALTLWSIWLAGHGRRIAWAIGAATQALWAAYAVATGQQWGLLTSSFAVGLVLGCNYTLPHRA